MRAFAVLTFVSITTAASAFAPCQSVQHVNNARPTAAAPLAASPLDNIFSAFKGGKGKAGSSAKVSAGDYDEDAAKTKSKLDNLIKKKPLLILSLTTCPYCTKGENFRFGTYRLMHHINNTMLTYEIIRTSNSLFIIHSNIITLS